MSGEAILSSCLTDNPVNSIEEDNLKAEDYANALARFIKNAATPVTIGIQGGWGSGKTSLITVLKHKLEDDPNHPALCVVVNAWEHSLFQSQEGRAEVALSLLSGLSSGLIESVEETSWLDKSTKDFVKNDSETIRKTIGGIKCGLMFAGKVATQMLSNMIGGGDVSNVKLGDASKAVGAMPQMAANVRELRKTLKEMVKRVTFNNKPVKIVFFIDDLDRVPPATAIEILDITKNIFDLPQCVFVLAIDYEVVVKGLENKFGPKDKDNEREFRQYFDKIIQIPFTMPIGAYGDNLADMLSNGLAELGYANKPEDKETLASLAENAKLATGGIPRSIKRVLNTLSLLQHIADARQKKNIDAEKTGLPADIIARFIIVALHINFPEIARRLMERPDFTRWNIDDLDSPWGLEHKEYEADLKLLAEDDYFNDPWEQVVYCLSAGSPWLKSMSRNLSRLMNNLLVALGGKFEEADHIPEEGLMRLNDILKGISVVSIDSAPANSSKFNTKNMAEHVTTGFFAKLQDAVAKKLPDIIPAHSDEEAWLEDGNFLYRIWLDGDMVKLDFIWSKDDEELYIYLVGKKPGKREEAEPIIAKGAGDYDWDWEDRNFYYSFTEEPYTQKDFSDSGKIGPLADQIVELYKAVAKTQAQLNKKLK